MKVLRPVASVVAATLFGVALSGSAFAQNTTLTIDGATAADNSASVNVAAGTVMTVTISNASLANRPYGLFAATANNAAGTGWFLDTNGGTLKKPFPVVTGVATSIVEADYPPLDLSPDRSANPRIKLSATGVASLSFRVPTGFTGTVYFQSAVLESSGTSTDFSNAITVTFAAAGTAARMVVSRGAANVDAATFGILQFSGGSPAGATFTPDPVFTNVKVDGISMLDINEWASHVSGVTLDKPRAVDWHDATFGPALNNENHEYPRIVLPATTGGAPSRLLMRCFNNALNQAFFMIVNRGDNPNTPGVDLFAVPGLTKTDSITPTLNSWKGGLLLSPDGTVAAAIYDDSSGAIDPQLFLFATDGSTPWLDSGSNPVAFVDVTPAGTKNFSLAITLRAAMFSDNRLWFAADSGSGDVDADTHIDQKLYTVDIRASHPTPAQVTINANSGYNTSTATAVVDWIADKSFLRPRQDASMIAFLAGGTLTAAAGTVSEHMKSADWYVVHESSPFTAINVSRFRRYPLTTGVEPKMVVPGDVYNGTLGQACLSPDGSKLAFISIHSEESSTAGEDDEVYVCTTADANGDLFGDESGDTLFVDGQVTLLSRIGTSAATGMDDGVDLFFHDNDDLYFWYGFDASATDKSMDLFRWKISTQSLANISQPSKVAPFNTAGTVLPEGYFFSPNDRYFYFARTRTGSTETNLVGIDTVTEKAFNVTGDEFAGATMPDTQNNNATPGENFNWHLSYAGGLFPSLCTFATAFQSVAANIPQHVFIFDADFPTLAVQVTNDVPGVTQNVESLSASPWSLGLSWAFTRSTTPLANMQYQDLLFFFRDSLNEPTTTSQFTSSVTLDAWQWVRTATSSDASGAAPPGLIVSIGDTGTDNASDSRLYYFSLNGSADYDFDDGTHEIGTTALAGLPFQGFIQIYHADVE